MIKRKKKRIGDRYQDSTSGFGDIWEIDRIDDGEFVGYYRCVCIDSGEDETTGTTDYFSFHEYYWTYLGNYAKDRNATTLWGILNS